MDGVDLRRQFLHHRRDAVEFLAGLVDLRHAFLDPLFLLLHDLEGVFNAVRVVRDERGDLLRRVCRLLGEFPHFLRDDSEAPTLLSGTRRLNGGIERQEVRLPGDAADHFHDLRNAFGAFVERRDGFRDALGALIQDFHPLHCDTEALLPLRRGRRHTLRGR